MMARALALLLLALALLAPVRAAAHALDPGYLSLQQTEAGAWRVFWRKPDVNGSPMAIDARLPDFCAPATGPAPGFDGSAWVARWVALCTAPLAGARIVIDGLDRTRTDVLVRIEQADGTITARLTAADPVLEIPAVPSAAEVFVQYLGLGFDHILEGIDHLLFVFALLVLIRSPGRLVGTVTAFTVAHSITLALATLGLVSVPGPPVEAAIALSIVLLAVEIVKAGRGQPGLTASRPWIVAFLFGLLHGLGFAGALTEIGLPPGDVPLALLAFNLGVEAGQLVFVAAVLAAFALLRRAGPALAHALHRPGAAGTRALGYGIGCVSVYWLTERLAQF